MCAHVFECIFMWTHTISSFYLCVKGLKPMSHLFVSAVAIIQPAGGTVKLGLTVRLQMVKLRVSRPNEQGPRLPRSPVTPFSSSLQVKYIRISWKIVRQDVLFFCFYYGEVLDKMILAKMNRRALNFMSKWLQSQLKWTKFIGPQFISMQGNFHPKKRATLLCYNG